MAQTAYSQSFAKELDFKQLLKLRGVTATLDQEDYGLSQAEREWMRGDLLCPSCRCGGTSLVRSDVAKPSGRNTRQAHFRFIDASGPRPGQIYRRADLAQWSTAVDRHLKEALQAGILTKLAGGLYYAPKQTAFGKAPPQDDTLVATFLKGGPFLLASPNAYNALGVGTTQLHNKTVVYNHKRHGKFALGGRTYDFRVKPAFPKTLTKEFLLVDLVNNLDQLGESADEVLERVKARLAASDRARVKKAAQSYGSERAKKFFARALAEVEAQDAA